MSTSKPDRSSPNFGGLRSFGSARRSHPADIKVGEAVFSRMSIGFDGLLNYYKGATRSAIWNTSRHSCATRDGATCCRSPISPWPTRGCSTCSATRHAKVSPSPHRVSTPARTLGALEPADAHLNEKIESFEYEGRRITNFEMESSALAGMASLMGTAPRRSARSSHSASRWTPARLQTVRQTDDPHGARQAGDDLIRTNASISRIIKIIETQHEIFRIKFRASVAAGDHR